ncbi:MAG TPA: hypothetical protein VIK97_18595, partial [Casimicrobiaceae bacterium]
MLGFSLLSQGCFRSRMLSRKVCPPGSTNCTPGSSRSGDASADAVHDLLGDSQSGLGSDGKRDASNGSLRDSNGDGPRGTGGDALADVPASGLRDVASEAVRDGQRDGNSNTADGRRNDLLGSDSRNDGGRDGQLDVPSDLVRDGRFDVPADRVPDGVICSKSEICGNNIDDDCNGLADCKDPACQSDPSCINKKKETCDNGIDDDGNGLIDCKDPACFGDKACTVPGKEICNNNLDDDDDGLIDCADPDCTKDPSCVVSPGKEICDNGKDDNGDGLIDCTDPQCKTFPVCLQAACTEDEDFGTIASSGDSKTRTISTVGATASYNTCASSPGGVARVAGFSLTATADVKLDFSQDKGSAHVVSLFRAGVGQSCDQNLVKCLDARDQ